jgi:pyruvate-formate lyase-activating enzyme
VIHGLLVMRWNWYIDTCDILLTYHGNYLEKLKKIVILVHFLYFHDDVIMTYHDHNKNQSSMGIKKKCHVRKIVILAIHGLLVMRWNWYIDTCHILLTYHGNYLEKLRKIVILVHFLYFHDDVIMTYHDHNKNQSSMGIKKKCHVRKIVILAIHGLLVMQRNWYIDTCHILLTYHGDYLEKLRKIVILVHFLYFHDDVIMTYHDHNKNQSSTGIKKNVM